ncbi:hypothetical protein WMF11_38085 [Sorangium sp. So ce295]|uniref:restriction endonuclease subunit S n=1 Tax=Sorangium sp. So ce295 TaxID=3133295 RepID=UPI003F62F5B2
MIEKLRPYPEYKAIGVPWLRQIPAHWDISRSKRLFSARKELAFPGDVQLSATQAYGVIPQSDFEARVGRRVVRISMHLEKRRHVEKDDFVISMRSFQGGLERAWASGAIRSSYVVLKAQAGVDVGYFTHLFKSHGYIRALQSTADFIRDGQDLNFSNFASIDLPLPPLAEQTIIGRFLYHANRRTDRFIQAKRRLIALLNEQKQAIIHRAVTCGIDPSVPRKNSGVEWLGEIPAHWNLRRLKTLSTFVTSGSRGWARYYSDTGSVFLRIGNISTSSIDLRTRRLVHVQPPADSERERTRTIANDLLLSITAQIGAVGVVPREFESSYVNQHTALIRLRKGTALSRWVGYVLLSPFGKAQCRLLTNGGTKVGLTLDDVRCLSILCPPKDEQARIVTAIELQCRGVEDSITRVEREISLIREYRTRLIADVVTGQLDVRATAARLPASDPDEPTPADLDDDATDDDLDEGEPE